MSKKRFTIFALVAILTLAFAGSAFAATTFTWVGGGADNKWSTRANWSPLPAANEYPGVNAAESVTFPAKPGGTTVVLDVTPADNLVKITASTSDSGTVTDPTTIEINAARVLKLVGGTADGDIVANSNLIISGAGKISNVTNDAEYTVAEDMKLDIQVGVETNDVLKTGDGELAYSATAVPAGLAPVDVGVDDDGGTFTISKRGLAAGITLGSKAVLNITGETVTLNQTAGTATHVVIGATATPAANAATVNIINGAKVTLAGGTGGITATGLANITVDETSELILGSATTHSALSNPANVSVNVAEGGVLKVGGGVVDAPIQLGALTASGNVTLNLIATNTVANGFTLLGSSTISGDITGDGTLILAANAANQTFKLLGSNNYSGTITVAGTIFGTRINGANPSTVEISGARSFGRDPIQMTGGNSILKVAGSFTLPNDISANNGTIEVPANTELTLTGPLTVATNAINKAGDGSLVLNGYTVGATAGINVNKGTLVLADENVAGANAITVANGASLKPGFSGISHIGALTFNANSTLLGLSEANKDEPLIIVEGVLTITAPLKVVTDYSGTWTKADVLKVAEYTTAGAGVAAANNLVRVYDADGNVLDTTPTLTPGSRYSTLTVSPSKDYIYPEISPVAPTTVKSTDLTFSLTVPVTSTSGLASATAEFVPAGEALTATIGDGVVTVSGPIPEVDGTYEIELTATANSTSSVAGQVSKGTITLVVETDGGGGGGGSGKETPVGGVPSADGSISWTATITTSSGASATTVAFDTGATAVINALKAIGVDTVEVVGATVVITGTLNDIGTGEYSIPILVNGTEEQTVKVTIDPIDNTTDAIDTTAQNWKGTYDNEDASFELYIPTDVTTTDAAAAVEVRATPVGLIVSSIAFDTTPVAARGADGVNIKVTGNITDETTAAITAVTYRIGINRYTQSMNVRLIDTDWTETGGPGNGGGGCDAGFGAFSLLMVIGGAALLRRKG